MQAFITASLKRKRKWLAKKIGAEPKKYLAAPFLFCFVILRFFKMLYFFCIHSFFYTFFEIIRLLINIITIIARVIKKYIRSFSIKHIIKDATSRAKGVRIRIYKPALIRMLDELKPMIICA